MPLVSIVVPVYKVEDYLRRCIDSILNQTFTDFELILVDDGSPDNCGSICDEYALMECRIRVIHKENGGVSTARNAGLDIADAQYVIFIDSDDYIGENYVANLVQSASDLTISGMETRDVNGNILRQRCYKQQSFANINEIDFSFLYENYMLYSPYCKLFKLDIINKWNIRFPHGITWGEDGMFVADYLCHINSLNVIEHVEYFYIKYGDLQKLSTNVRENIVDTIALSREYCISKMQETSPRDYSAVQRICSEDIKYNCAYFIVRLLESKTVKIKEKIMLLDRFLANKYVKDINNRVEIYYTGKPNIQKALKKAKAEEIVMAYIYHKKKSDIIKHMYYSIYERLPFGVKQAYRNIKRNGKYDS